MTKQLGAVAILLTCSAVQVQSQAPVLQGFNNGAATPSGWTLEGGANIDPSLGRSGGGLVLGSATARAILRISNPNYLTFFRRPPQGTDDFTLEVSSSCAPTFEASYRPERADPVPYIMSVVNARHAGVCTITFAVREYRAGEVIIDDVEVGQLDSASYEDLAEKQRVEAILARQRYEAELNGARRRLDENAASLVTTTRGLGVRVSRTYALEAIQALGSAMALRTAVNNPLEYTEFTNVLTKVEAINTPIRTHTTSLRETVNGAFRIVKSALQGDIFDAVSQLVSTTSVLSNFRDSFRDLLALSSMNNQSRDRLADALRMNRDTANTGIANLYSTTNTFLERMIHDADHVDASARMASELAARTRRSANQGDSVIVVVLKYAGLSGTAGELDAFKRAAVLTAEGAAADSTVIVQVRNAVAARVMEANNAPANEKVAAMNDLAGRFEQYIRQIQQVSSGLDPLVGEQTLFFRREIEYICNLEPVTTQSVAIQEKWQEMARAAARALIAAETAFYKAYNFTDTPARTCRLLN